MTLWFLQVIEVEGQLTELFQINRNLQVQNDEIPILRDSIEEMRYLESKVVCVCVCGCGWALVWVCVGVCARRCVGVWASLIWWTSGLSAV